MGFGTMGLSSLYGAVGSDEERFEVLDRAFELGEDFWDTADMYGDSEDLIGKWFKRTGKRNEVILRCLSGVPADANIDLPRHQVYQCNDARWHSSSQE